MVKTSKVEMQENSSAKLSITIGSEDTQKEYKALLSKYSKEAHIKGFRPGKAPASVLEKKFGESIRQEVMGNLIESGMKEAVEKLDKKEQPLGYAYPELDGEPKFTPGEDFNYAIKYDVFPSFELGEYKKLKIKTSEPKILKKHETAELERLQEQNSVTQAKKNKTIADKDIVTINYCEVDDKDNVVASTEREAFVFTVGTEQNLYKLDNDIIGMKVDEEKIFDKKFDKDFSVPELAGTTKKIKVKVTDVKEKILPKLDDELAQDVNEKFETLDQLKDDIKKQIQEQANAKAKELKVTAILDQLRENTAITLPKSMIDAELENSWKNYIQRFGMPEEQILQFLTAQGKTKADLLEEWKEDAAKSLHSQVILGEIQEQEKIEATEEEIDAEIAKQAEQYNMKVEDLKKTFGESGLNDYLKNDIKQKKVVDFLIDSATITKGDKIDFDDFMKL